ncbi:Os02g0437901 [Oryza sativa Japonica Group]|uniref:Os02g0437901 protein n=1 Tax=Oryza sativa subsp. japonica TaxID=39947 RepID=A0A0P0VIH7_ORYSJ|nr:hypothetical protein EE612_010982 [Oryza sativa]BAS78469.1 Os02g0437901 [Oryza sativa Japonica Group]
MASASSSPATSPLGAPPPWRPSGCRGGSGGQARIGTMSPCYSTWHQPHPARPPSLCLSLLRSTVAGVILHRASVLLLTGAAYQHYISELSPSPSRVCTSLYKHIQSPSNLVVGDDLHCIMEVNGPSAVVNENPTQFNVRGMQERIAIDLD